MRNTDNAELPIYTYIFILRIELIPLTFDEASDLLNDYYI
jgi:hypothetical protein